jgi:hypothetical protein
MAVQFRPLPLDVFQPDQRTHIARLNQDLRDLFALEGVIRNPLSTRRSDQTIVRRGEVQVDVSRITPSITGVVSGSSTVVGTPALTLGTSNVVGSTATALSTNSTIALFGTQAASDLVTSATVGTSAFAARGDHAHPFPESLGTLADRSKSITLTNHASLGALLTASSTWSASLLTLFAPAASGGVIIDPNGFVGAAGNIPAGAVPGGAVMTFSTTLGSSVSGAFTGILGNIAVTGSNADSNTQLNGGQCIAAYGATIGNSKEQIGFIAKAQITNSAGSGDCTGLLAQINVSGITTRTNVTCVKALPLSAINGTITTLRGFLYSHVNAGGTILSTVGYDCTAITRGTSAAIGFRSAGHTVGSTFCCGFEAALHTSGTLRRSFAGDNSLECRQNHMVVGTSGFGFVVKDTVDGNYYVIKTASGTIGSSSIGTTVPAV